MALRAAAAAAAAMLPQRAALTVARASAVPIACAGARVASRAARPLARLVVAVAAASAGLGGAVALKAKAPPGETERLDAMHDQQDRYPPAATYDAARKLSVMLEDDDPAVLWRVARAAYILAMVPGTPDDAKKRLLQEALDAVRQSHEANTGDGPMHRWYGIILSEQRKYMSNKEQIVALYDIRDHFVQATEINPYDASAYHLLGQWAYGIANLGFVLRQAAKVLFGTPPKATVLEALGHFQRAEELSPGTWKMNTVYVGIAHKALGNKELALHWGEKALAAPTVTDDDRNAHKLADELVKSLRK